MLKIRLNGRPAKWDHGTRRWECSHEGTRAILQAHYQSRVAASYSPRDRFLENGLSGRVWSAVEAFFGQSAELVKLTPDPVPKLDPNLRY